MSSLGRFISTHSARDRSVIKDLYDDNSQSSSNYSLEVADNAKRKQKDNF